MVDWSAPGLNYPEYPAGSVVELRVHGVGGEPPAVMTRDPHPEQVAGDEVIGVFRARDPVVGALGNGVDTPLHVREVVSWGAQTSGTWRHALWVLLLPFAMFNVAGRMHLPGDRGKRHRMLCRVLGLTMTLTTIGLSCTIGMDLVATQYVDEWPKDAQGEPVGVDPAGGAEGVQQGSAAEPDGEDPGDESGDESQATEPASQPPFWVVPFRAYLEDPAGALALAAVLPSLVLIMLWVASRYQYRRARSASATSDIEEDAEPLPSDVAESPPTDESLRLTDRDFWATQWATSRLRGLHVTAGTAWIAGTLAVAVTASRLPPSDDVGSALGSAGSAVTSGLVVVQAIVAIAALFVAGRPRLLREERVAGIDWALWAMRLAALGPLGWMLGAWLPTDVMVQWISEARLSPIQVLATVLALVLLVLVVDDGRRFVVRAGLLAVAAGLVAVAWATTWLAVLSWPAALWVGLAGGAMVLEWGLVTRPRPGAAPSGPDMRGWPSLLLVVGGALLGVALPHAIDMGTAWSPGEPWLADALVGILLGERLGAAGSWRVGVAPYLPLIVLGLVQVILIGGLALVSLTPQAQAMRQGVDGVGGASQVDDGRAITWNAGAVVLAMLSLFILVAVGAGLHGLVADLLGDRVIGLSLVGDGPVPRVSGDPPIVIVPWLVWSAKVMIGILVVAPVWAGLFVWRRLSPPRPDEVRRHMVSSWDAFGATGGPGELDPDDVTAIGTLWNNQWLLRNAGSVLLAGVAGGLLVLAIVLLSLSGEAVAGLELAWLDGVSMALVVLLPAAGFLLVRSSLSARATRRQVGRLWDVLTFWPRVTHPFAPPCYAEELVPAIAERCSRIVTGSWPAKESPRSPSSVILAGHSQGSMVSLAAAAQLPPAVARRVAMVSYGSPVAILYERMFREPFAGRGGPDTPDAVMRSVEARAHNWHHLTCMTEPFAMPFWHVDGVAAATATARDGWPVTLDVPFAVVTSPDGRPCPVCAPGRSKAGDFLIRDPLGWDLSAAGGRLLPADGHSAYRRSPDVDAHMASIAASLHAARVTVGPA